MKYVGKTEEYGDTIIKNYDQTVSGSAWKKIGTDVILMRDAGFKNIIVRFNDVHPNRDAMIQVMKSIQRVIPGVKVEVLTTVVNDKDFM